MSTSLNVSSRRVFSRFRALRAGFTLIELLVVISIISLLVAVLLPALAKSREAVSRTLCLSNMRQMGIGLNVYMAEFNEMLPVFTSSINYYSGVMQTASVVASQGGDFANHAYMQSVMPTKVRACPEVQASANRFSWGWSDTSVSQNRYGYEFPAINAGASEGVTSYMASRALDIYNPKPNHTDRQRFEYIRTTVPGLSVGPTGAIVEYYGREWEPVGTRPLMTDINSFTTQRLIASHRPGAGRVAYDVFSPAASGGGQIYPAIAGSNHLDYDGSAKWIVFIYPAPVYAYRDVATGRNNIPKEHWTTETGTTSGYVYWGKRSKNIR